MATRTIPAVTVVTDDFTGKDLAEIDKPVSVTLTVDGKKYTLDMAEPVRTRFIALISGSTDENRREFGDILPRTPVGKASGTKPSGDTASARAWLASLTDSDRMAVPGYKPEMITPGSRGKLPDETMTAWRTASNGQATTPATDQASNPAA